MSPIPPHIGATCSRCPDAELHPYRAGAAASAALTIKVPAWLNLEPDLFGG